mgnify:CR=1 FL=1
MIYITRSSRQFIMGSNASSTATPNAVTTGAVVQQKNTVTKNKTDAVAKNAVTTGAVVPQKNAVTKNKNTVATKNAVLPSAMNVDEKPPGTITSTLAITKGGWDAKAGIPHHRRRASRRHRRASHRRYKK